VLYEDADFSGDEHERQKTAYIAASSADSSAEWTIATEGPPAAVVPPPTLPNRSWMERPGADQRFKYGPYKGETYGSVAMADSKPKSDWIKMLRKTKPENRAQYQKGFVRWMDERSVAEGCSASGPWQDKVPTAEGQE